MTKRKSFSEILEDLGFEEMTGEETRVFPESPREKTFGVFLRIQVWGDNLTSAIDEIGHAWVKSERVDLAPYGFTELGKQNDEPRNCKTCKQKMNPHDIVCFTEIQPRIAFKCRQCDTTLLVFTTLGETDLEIWRDEFPQGMPFTEVVTEKLSQRQRYKLN